MTWLPRSGARQPMVVDGRTILGPESAIVWFTFPGAWHDIGRFHDGRGRFTAWYANILTPVEIDGDRWATTDLFLDVLLEPGREPRLLDTDELAEAVGRGWVDTATAGRAEAEAARLLELARAGAWPPAVVREWTLERARAAAGHPPAGPGVSPATERLESEE